MNEFGQRQSEELKSVLNEAQNKFAAYKDADWSLKKAPGKWSRKEILGHLTDSAANNHIRFIRAQVVEGDFVSHKYEQEEFVSLQKYQEIPAAEIVQFWFLYNQRLTHVIRNVHPEKLDKICRIGDYDPCTLAFLIEDYIVHMKHHLKQIYDY